MHDLGVISLMPFQESISSAFYARIFCRKFWALKITIQCFGFEIFWRQNIGAKYVRKMLMKLTSGALN